MSELFQQLVEGCQVRFRRLRQLTQFYHRFAGSVIRIQQDRDCILTHLGSTGGTVELSFEERDQDGLIVRIEPFRNDLVFINKVGFWAEMHFELFRFCLDPVKLQRANNMQLRSSLGGLFGGGHTREASWRGSSASLAQPGVMRLHSSGSRIHVSTMLIWDLGRYQLEGGSFDLPAISRDLDAVSHGLEKCLEGMTAKG